MRIDVYHVSYTSGDTVAVGRGTEEDGREITFAGDWRPMLGIAEAISAEEAPVSVEIEDYQVLHIGPEVTA